MSDPEMVPDALRSGVRQGGRTVLQVKDLRTHLYTRWGIVKAVDGVSLDLKEGECFGVVGESGSGKSMLSLSLMRLLPKPSGRIVSGQILLDGEDIVKKSEAEMSRIRGRRIAMVMQDPMTALDPVFTIGKQLGETIAIDGTRKKGAIHSCALELLKLVRIPAPEDRLRSFPFQLSGGMRQRVVGAIAMAQRPCILIADEPTTALDVTTQANYLRLLKDLQEETGLTLLFITHDFGIVASVCHRVGVMYAGRLVEVGDVEEIFDRPIHPYTRCLIDAVPKLDRKVARLTSIGGHPPTLHDLPPGCAFSPRCSELDNRCRPDSYPTMVEVDKGHFVSCWKCR